MINCTTCTHCENEGFRCNALNRLGFLHFKSVETCSDYEPKLMTNGDRIRIMVNREMMRVVECPAKIEHTDCINPDLPCPECKRRWLEMPVKEAAE